MRATLALNRLIIVFEFHTPFALRPDRTWEIYLFSAGQQDPPFPLVDIASSKGIISIN